MLPAVADVSVRPARAADAAEIARIQVATWRIAYARLLPADVLAEATQDRAAGRWEAAVARPPTPRHRVLVAQEQHWLVGFVAFGPATPADLDGPEPAAEAEVAAGTGPVNAGDPDRTGEIVALLVEPRWGRRGHGSRLLAATIDYLRDGDRASANFYTSAGWQPDGHVRRLDDASGSVVEVCYHVSVLDAEGEAQA